ncbi:MAG: hypothetical protein WD470_09345 [Rhodospirillaceae bacterium]
MKLIALMLGVPAALAIWLAIFLRWQRGIYFLVAFLPYAGIVTLIMRPSPVGTLVKDLLLVLPTYAIFFLMHTSELRKARIPNALTLLLLAFAGLVLLQLFNPGLQSMIVGAVGAKVWLLYIPLAYLVSVAIEKPEDLVRLMRLAVAVAVIPCVLGIAQFVMASTMGYEATMRMFYGSNAADVTQDFTFFNMGADFFRIPSTFTFVTQYSGFTLMMVAVTYMHQSIEPDLRWRTFARAMMGVAFVACMLSGARSNFLFTPMLFMTILFLDAKLTRLALGLVFGPLVMATTLQGAGIDILRLIGATTQLTQSYGSDLVLPDLIRSIAGNPLGTGTGMNTGGTANLMSQAQLASTRLIEGYYAKAAVELGFPGLMLIAMIIAGLILYGLQARSRLRDPMARSCAAAIVAFLIVMAIHSFKGWQVDLDPINVWYWILVGILFRLPYLQFADVAEQRRQAEAQRTARSLRRPRRARGRQAPRPAPQRTGR